MANRVCARSLLGLRPFQNAQRTLCSAPPSSHIDPHYLSEDVIDIEKLFLDGSVRKSLKQLTGFNLNRIYAKKRKEIAPPSYKLLTDAQLKAAYAKAVKKAEHKLSMPPVMRQRVPCERILRKDPEMQGYEKHKFIFTDVSFGYSDRFRPIVVREPNGVLRTATWLERDRMLQTYLTRPERELMTPPIFFEPHLTKVLDRGWYEFVLNRACVQFEPDHEDYIRVTHRVYDHIKENSKFDELHSTRHCGPMCFYFAVTKKGDALVLHLLKTNRLQDAAEFVKLLHIIHPESRSAELVNERSTSMDLVEAFIKMEAQMKTQLDLALRSYYDVAQEATA